MVEAAFSNIFNISRDYVLFFAGFSYIILATACLITVRQGRKELPWLVMAHFALFFGIGALIELPAIITEHPLFFKAMKLFFSLAGAILLVEFARRGNPLADGKTLGRWVLILPVLAMLAGLPSQGLEGAEQVVHNSFGVLGFLGTAIVFWRRSRLTAGRERLYLFLIGISFLLFALNCFWRHIPPLQRITQTYFQAFQHLHYEAVHPFIAGVLTLSIAFLLTQVTFLKSEDASVSAYLNRKSRSYFYISAFIVLVIFLGGWQLTNQVGRYFLKETASLARLDADMMADHLGGILESANQGAMHLANIKSIREAITGKDKKKLELAGEDLANALFSYKLNKCLLVDQLGRVIASSQIDINKVPRGIDPSLPVLANALSGRRGYEILFDEAVEAPLYWVGFPVRDIRGNIKGALILVKNMQEAEYSLRKHKYSFLIDEDGVIILAGQPGLRLMRLWPLSAEEKLSSLKRDRHGFTPRGALLAGRSKDNIFNLDGSPHLLVRSFHQWPIHILTRLDHVRWARLATILVLFLLASAVLIFFIDSSRLVATSARLLNAETRFEVIFHSVPSAIMILDKPDGKILSENTFVQQWLGYDLTELQEMTLKDLRAAPPKDRSHQHYRKKDGAVVDVEEVQAVITLDDEINQLIIAHDVTDRNRAEEDLRLAKEFSDSVVKIAAAMIVVLDRKGNVVLFNDHAEQVTGWRREEVLGQGWFNRFIPKAETPAIQDVFQILLKEKTSLAHENPIITKDGEQRIINWNNTTLQDRNGEARLVIATGVDVTQQKKNEAILTRLSLSDGLTGVANRRSLDDFLDRQWKRAAREGTSVSLIMGDIDFFKRYNDTLGHQAGDACLIRVAAVMQSALKRPLDLLARFGGEEFAVVLPDTEKEGALKVAHDIQSRLLSLGLPHPDSDAGPLVTMSLGVASATPLPGMPAEELIAAADKALYQAKAGGRNRIEYAGFPTGKS
ncbi:MAG: diguanylate cyclase [Smithellaceae bacterium]|nr:diguanylate cyclase [Smithellaceae bacterium]